MVIFGLSGRSEGCQLGVDSIDFVGLDGTVCDASVMEGRLVILVIKEFLREEVFEFEPSAGGVGGVVRFPVVTRFIHMGELQEMSEGGANHGGVGDWFG